MKGVSSSWESGGWSWLKRVVFGAGRRDAAARPGRKTHLRRLRKRDLLVVDARRPAGHLSVRSGVVWLTRSPGDADHVLRAGDSCPLRRDKWPVVVEALEASEIVLTE